MDLNFVDDHVTDNFRLSEFANTLDGNKILINAEVVGFYQDLEKFRKWYNRPMVITSGYRTPAFNKRIGGVSNSYHVRGLAVDFKLPVDYFKMDLSRRISFILNIRAKWYNVCRVSGHFGSVILYDSWIHLSYWPYQYWEDKRVNRGV